MNRLNKKDIEMSVKFNALHRDLLHYLAMKAAADPKLDPPTVASALLHVLLSFTLSATGSKAKSIDWISTSINAWPGWKK